MLEFRKPGSIPPPLCFPSHSYYFAMLSGTGGTSPSPHRADHWRMDASLSAAILVTQPIGYRHVSSGHVRPALGPYHDPSRISCDHLAFDLAPDRLSHHHDDHEHRPSSDHDLRHAADGICAFLTFHRCSAGSTSTGMALATFLKVPFGYQALTIASHIALG